MHGTRWEGEMKLERQVDGQRIRQWESYVLMRNSAKTPIAGGGGGAVGGRDESKKSFTSCKVCITQRKYRRKLSIKQIHQIADEFHLLSISPIESFYKMKAVGRQAGAH